MPQTFYKDYNNPASCGMINEIAGINVINNKNTTCSRKNGRSRFITCSIRSPETLHPVNKIGPTGGVIVPMQKLNTMITPKCTTLYPKDCANGKNIGVNIKSAGVGSSKHPIINITKFISSINRMGFSVIVSNVAAIKLGRLVNAITQLNIEETPIIKIIIPVVLADSKNIVYKSFTVIERYIAESSSE